MNVPDAKVSFEEYVRKINRVSGYKNRMLVLNEISNELMPDILAVCRNEGLLRGLTDGNNCVQGV